MYIRQFPDGDSSWRVSTEEGYWPRWSPNGDRIYYSQTDGTIMQVEVQAGDPPMLGKPVVVLERKASGIPTIFGWPEGFAVSADGERVLTLVNAESGTIVNRLMVVENWLSEFAKPGQ